MLVQPIHAASHRRRTYVAPSRTLTVPVGSSALAVSDPSKAGGEWVVDWARARADAQRVIDSIDFSQRDIVIWVPGTSNHGPHPAFAAAIREAYASGGVSLVGMDYEASWHLRRSLPTGIATLKLVLEAIRAHGGAHRVLLGGESQGAWIIGEAIADPSVSSVIDRAMLLGHPWLAQHQYTEGQDPRVRVINHDGDMVAMKVNGDPTVGLDAILAIRTLDLSRADDLVKGLIANPRQGVELLKGLVRALPFVKDVMPDPHVYDPEMKKAVEFLRAGAVPTVNYG